MQSHTTAPMKDVSYTHVLFYFPQKSFGVHYSFIKALCAYKLFHALVIFAKFLLSLWT